MIATLASIKALAMAPISKELVASLLAGAIGAGIVMYGVQQRQDERELSTAIRIASIEERVQALDIGGTRPTIRIEQQLKDIIVRLESIERHIDRHLQGEKR